MFSMSCLAELFQQLPRTGFHQRTKKVDECQGGFRHECLMDRPCFLNDRYWFLLAVSAKEPLNS